MSFLGGAECSTAANPLTRFAKHVQDDRSLQRDRVAGRLGGGEAEARGMRSGVVDRSGRGDLVGQALGWNRA